MISNLCSRKCLAVLLVLALAPATAFAATAKSSKKASKRRAPAATSTPAPAPEPVPEPTPAPETAPALAQSSALDAQPARRLSSTSPALGGAVGGLDFGAQLALDIPTQSGLTVGPRINGEVMYGMLDLAPNLRLAVGGRVSFAYHSGDANASAWLIEGVPDAKIKFALNDMIALYGDLGLGLSFQHVSVDFLGGSASDDTVTFTVQFGAGATYAITPKLNLVGEVRFDLYTRSNASHSIAVPTIGVQWH